MRRFVRSMPVRSGSVAVVAAALLAVPGTAAGARLDANVLVADVGANDSFVISLKTVDGNPVTHLDAGTYTIVVHDRSKIHNFHLVGPGIDKVTGILFVGDVTWTVTLTDGTYRYQCDPHVAVMEGAFGVGTAPPPPAKLIASVGPGSSISLKQTSGARVSSLAAGRYVITVRDRTRKDGFRLIGPGVTKSTGIAFVGTTKWTLFLKPGKYTYRCIHHRLSRGTFVVAAAP